MEGGPGLALGDVVMLKTLCRALTAWMKHLHPRVRLPGKSLNAPNGAHVPVTLRPSLCTYRSGGTSVLASNTTPRSPPGFLLSSPICSDPSTALQMRRQRVTPGPRA